ncbi:hypothetical protein Dvina_14210 [Dactylosporangium vinaceum]|uniref:PLL-like beta propeller domain-containing protein n=1 Tax=Dactylosporangium vinaceum TaxID=53362 RepID=A0ABV5MHT2_9ACTN|nr:hypothetical protein [Dactylosporangium vinaceum]UAB99122.1 hypothetical protein Dvina_14210 [Dactylosporangium vinaceum]
MMTRTVRRALAVILAGALLILVGSVPARAIIVPPDPNDPNPPTYPPGSSGWCYVNSGGRLTTPAATVGAGAFLTLNYTADVPSQCMAYVHVYGPGSDGQANLGSTGSMTVNAPIAFGTATWNLSVTIPGQVPKTVGSTSVTVVAPRQSAVAVARNGDGRMEYFRTQSSGALTHRSQTAAGGVSAWTPFDGSLNSIAAETGSDGRVEVFGVSAQGTPWYRYQLVAGAGTWSDWQQFPSWQPGTDTMLTLAVTRDGAGRLHVFGSTPAGQLWQSVQGQAGNPDYWTAWTSMGSSSLVALAAGTDADGTIELVGLRPDGAILQRWSTGSGWTEFSAIPGGLTSIAMARQGDGRLELIGTNMWDSIWENWQTGPNQRAGWNGWQLASGQLVSVGAQTNAAGAVEVLGVNRQQGFFHTTRSGVGGAWSWPQFDETVAPSGSTVAAPSAGALQVGAQGVGTRLTDRSTNEAGFQVQRRDNRGRWAVAHNTATTNAAGTGDTYDWTDTADLSGQCYRFVAYTHDDFAATAEQCGVRPDGGRFPQAVSTVAQQWSGFSTVNGGTGELHNTKTGSDVVWQERTFGENLGWGNADAWTFEAQGGPQLMKGQALALRLGSHGYLRYSHRQFGVDLELTSEPVYEWYVIGGGSGEESRAGTALSGGGAIWNRTAQAYLVNGGETWGIDLNWYQVGDGSTPPMQNPPPTQFTGIGTVKVVNCAPDQHPLEVFLQDRSAGGGFTDKGSVAPAWVAGGCPGQSPPTVTFSGLIAGHQYVLVTTDRLNSYCGSHTDNPLEGGCQTSVATFTGDTSGNGHTLTQYVGINIVVT